VGTKTIGLREDVYERLKARKREDESFTDLVDRLIDETTVDWRETFGSLPEEDAAELERVATRSRRTTSEGFGDRGERAVEAFADLADDELETGRDGS
jgi:predicted CopG family antitoxin